MRAQPSTATVWGVAGALCVLIITTVIALIALGSIVHDREHISDARDQLAVLDRLRADVRELSRASRRYLSARDAKERQRVYALRVRLAVDRSSLKHPGKVVDDAIDDYLTRILRAINRKHSDPVAGIIAIAETRVALLAAIDEIADRERARLPLSPELERLIRGMRTALIVAGVLGLVLVVGLAMAIARRLRRLRDRERELRAATERAINHHESTLDQIHAAVESVAHHAARIGDPAARIEVVRTCARLESLLIRSRAGELMLYRQPCDATALVEASVRRHRELAVTRGVGLRFEAELGLTVIADRRRISDLLATLVHEAIDMSRGSTNIIVAARGCPDSVLFEISVTGPLAVASTRDLSDLEHVLEAHGGRLRVEATATAARYHFTLPGRPTIQA